MESKMTVQELFNLLEEQIRLGRGNYTVKIWDLSREDITDLLRDDYSQELYICSGN